ncbi:MAG TPA: alpha/beta hydrolase-fold protein [Streptosporangiaceae bacterium]|nr:alpha/beta hydrolase-fold protein [Streptosporangiaceae bacterium]
MMRIEHAPVPGWRQIRHGWRALLARRRLTVVMLAVLGVLLAVSGTAGVVRYGVTFWLYRGFPAPTVPHGVASPRVETITVVSPALDGYRDTVDVVLPPGYASDPARRYPVVYLLHGFTGRPSDFLGIGDLAGIYASLLAAGKIQPMILVMPTGTRSFFADEEWANGVRDGNQWETFVARDLVNAIDARYRTIRSAGSRGLAGYSEGGYGALNIGIHHPAEFGLLESWSGYTYADNIPALFGRDQALLRYNSPSDQVVSAAPQLRTTGTYIWFYCGRADEYAGQDRDFAAELTPLGIAHDFFWEPGSHTWRLWRDMMPQALITASEHLRHG